VALLISLFALLLISIVGVALIIASGTDSALTGNYHAATSVYYGALAGLEEGRGRLLPSSPNYFGAFAAPPGTVLDATQVRYILNPAPGENVAPQDTSAGSLYPDKEYALEFPTTTPNVQSTASVSPLPAVPGPTYKWVRINAATEQSLNLDINGDGIYNSTTALFYDGVRLNLESSGVQALEITSLAALPNGSQRMLQYVVAPLTLTFPAALILDGSNVTFTAPPSNTFSVSGLDTTTVNGCAPAPGIGAAGIGYPNNNAPGDTSLSNILAGIASANPPAGYPGSFTGNYTGIVATPNVEATVIPPNLQTNAALNGLVLNIAQKADVVVGGPANQSVLPVGMTAANPRTIVVNGDLTLDSGTPIGYGTLVVTGTLSYDPDVSWNGIVLVIGKGHLVALAGGGGGGGGGHGGGGGGGGRGGGGGGPTVGFNGAVLVAKTLADDGITPLPQATPGSSSSDQTGGGAGFFYSSCWINTVQNPVTYKVLSFREIPQVTP
jgi:hypothetical protein